MPQALTLVLQLIEEFVLPNLSNPATVKKILDVLTEIIPVAIKEAQDVSGPIKNIIVALRGTDVITTEQLDQLDALEDELDAAFDAAADAAAKDQ